jgi:hypothetical protein
MTMKGVVRAGVGVLLVSMSYSVGARNAIAGYCDHATTGPVIAMDDSQNMVLRFDGTTWTFENGTWRQYLGLPDLPVPVADIAFWRFGYIVTHTGTLWRLGFPGPQWIDSGQIPLPPISAHGASWQAIKSRYRK